MELPLRGIGSRERLAGLVVASVVILAAAAVSISATKPAPDQVVIASTVEGVVHEYLAGAAVSPDAIVNGRIPDDELDRAVDAGKARLARYATGQAFDMLSKNIDYVADIERLGERGAITSYESDALLIDLLESRKDGIVARGREHGVATFSDPAGQVDRASQWSYFDVTLVDVGGSLRVATFRMIPTLSDDPEGIDPYPIGQDPAGGDPTDAGD